MAHSLFAGMTLMGKTSLARALCASYKRRGFDTIILDPLKDPKWAASYITDDGDDFLYMAKQSRKCMLFLDEGSESVGRYNVPMQWTATQARHWGHSSHFITQVATQIAPIVREQCAHAFLFAAGKRAGKTLSEEFNAPDLEMCVSLQPYEYFHAVKGGACHFHSEKRSYADAISTHASRGRPLLSGSRKAQTEEAGNAARDDVDNDDGHDGDATQDGGNATQG